jgi:hypothetical membrane protein
VVVRTDDRRVSPGRPRAAVGGIIGPAAFVTAWSIGGLAATHYSAVDDAISNLAEIGAPTRGLMTTGFVVFGVGVPLYSLALRESLPGWSWLTAAATGVATLGVAAAPLGRSAAGDTVHGLFAGAGYVTLALTPLLAAGPLRRGGRRVLARLSIVAGAAAAISLLATTVTDANGLFQRLGLTIVDVWIGATAVEILRDRLTTRRSDEVRGKLAG